ncbi:hypothetical protein HanXRQr2_Chr05g0195741 [Helianthus annuus]|uniref:Uncharacterized protein n=1 Tax=Helianthus annuus TaxID=4232 RepID=A0A9K3NM45_HELAN|nr:hypothetical protein HanXRQr2_Chr05g0195741 [Helianthus annuus]
MRLEHSPHHQDSCQDVAAVQAYDMLFLFPVETQFFPPQKIPRTSSYHWKRMKIRSDFVGLLLLLHESMMSLTSFFYPFQSRERTYNKTQLTCIYIIRGGCILLAS